jgi:hypothetical protein
MDAQARAAHLLSRIRDTPMRRGALPKAAQRMRAEISRALADNGVPEPLARRIAFQLVLKIDLAKLRDAAAWSAMARVLCDEVETLTYGLGLARRQIVAVLPKLSPAQLEEFFDELMRADRRIARTVLDAAVYSADPISTGRRYLVEYRLVVKKLQAVEPTLARTLANATFKAGMPFDKALEHVERFLMLIASQKDHPDIADLLARAGLRDK